MLKSVKFKKSPYVEFVGHWNGAPSTRESLTEKCRCFPNASTVATRTCLYLLHLSLLSLGGPHAIGHPCGLPLNCPPTSTSCGLPLQSLCASIVLSCTKFLAATSGQGRSSEWDSNWLHASTWRWPAIVRQFVLEWRGPTQSHATQSRHSLASSLTELSTFSCCLSNTWINSNIMNAWKFYRKLIIFQ
jgi:hypothetical protein